jgi:hypothetical protein
MWMGSSSMLPSCVGMVGAPFGEGEGESGGSTGTGTNGVFPSRSCWSVRMACILLGVASWMLVMASVRICVAATILSMDVMVGMGMAWFFETKGVGELFPTSALHYCFYALIELQRRTNVPSVGGVEAPCFAFCWFEMDQNFGARWSHGGIVELMEKELSMDSKAESAGF